MYKVMLVDDWEVFRIQFNRKAKWNEQKDFELVYEASNGKEALAYFKEHAVDCIITDIRMPEMDGVELLKEVRQLNSTIPVVFFSEYEDFYYAKEAISHRVFDYLVKPVNKDELDGLFSKLKEELAVLDNRRSVHLISYDELISRIINSDMTSDTVCELTNEWLAKAVSTEDKVPFSLFKELVIALDTRIKEQYSWVALYRVLSPIEVIERLCAEMGDSHIAVKRTINYIVKPVNELYRSASHQPLIEKASRYLLSQPRQRTIQSLADHFYVNKNYLSDTFKKETGETLNEYMSFVNVSRAKVIAWSSDRTNSVICEELGYQHTDYFARLFKKVSGNTLTEYRKYSFLDIV